MQIGSPPASGVNFSLKIVQNTSNDKFDSEQFNAVLRLLIGDCFKIVTSGETEDFLRSILFQSGEGSKPLPDCYFSSRSRFAHPSFS